jgi:hypothetical protein
VSFFRIARDAAAAEYGRARAEKYGRRAKVRTIAGLALASVLLVWIYAASQGWFGG